MLKSSTDYPQPAKNSNADISKRKQLYQQRFKIWNDSALNMDQFTITLDIFKYNKR